MSLVHQYLTRQYQWGLWKIEEDQDFFEQNFDWHPAEKEAIAKVSHPAKKLQKLAARACFKSISDLPRPIFSDDKGKPYLPDGGMISLSHSDHFACAIWSPSFPVAIDVERIDTQRSFRTAQMFMNPLELRRLNVLDDHRYFYLLWCLKECLFKVLNHHISEISFQRHLYTLTTAPDFETHTQGTVVVGCKRDDLTFETTAQYMIWEDYMLAYLCSTD